MHRTNPFFDDFSSERKRKDAFASSLSTESEVTMDALVYQCSKEFDTSVARRHMSSAHHSGAHCRGSSAGKELPRIVNPRMPRGECNVIEPMRMLHSCIRYFASHPEIYGNDLRTLLDRELIYCMRVKASESSLLTPGTVPVTNVPLTSMDSSKGKKNKLTHPALKKCTGWLVAPRSVEAAVSGGIVAGCEGMFGYGAISFVEPSPGFLSLLDKSSRCLTLNDEQMMLEQSNEGVEVPPLPNSSLPDINLQDKCGISSENIRPTEGSRVRFLSNSRQPFSRFSQSSPVTPPESESKLLIDGASYEVSFLRSQLQQVEAAYNAKCICLRELQQESNQHKTELQITEKKLQQSTAKNNEMMIQIESLKRELDAWKQRATESTIFWQKSSSQDSRDVSRRMQAMQLGEAKRELTHMSRLWRETEKALQETKRALEGAEKEAQLSHRYLEDAFGLIERLERRIVRRDDYIEVQQRRYVSVEEKYEKLLWCHHELQTLKGVYSYVDYLLSEDPAWLLFLFVRLQQRFMGFAHIEEPLPTSPKPLYFRRTPLGGKLFDVYSQDLVYRLVINDISGKNKNVDDICNIRMGNRILRWRGIHSINYIGGLEPSLNTTNSPIDVTIRMSHDVPVLTLASVLLPQQSISLEGDVMLETEVPNSLQYDQTTLRLLLYNFWAERLEQYKMGMTKCLNEVKEMFENGVGYESEHKIEGTDNSTNIPLKGSLTFLAALVSFLRRLYPLSTKSTTEKVDLTKSQKLIVRGAVTKIGKYVDNGRMCLSSIVDVMEDGTEIPVTLSSQARELLYALYYYAEEYKEVDSDFRLFYLVAHQQIPEIVAINFFASLEALRKSCEETLINHMGLQPVSENNIATEVEVSSRSNSLLPQDPLRDEAPYDVLKRTVEIIDTAPVVDEDTCIEPDSDGEGFGLILQGTTTGGNSQKAETEVHMETVRPDFNTLKHNICQYLFSSDAIASSSQTTSHTLKPTGENNRGSTNPVNDNNENVNTTIPTAWVTLDEQLGALLGPHVSLLKAFQTFKDKKCNKDMKHFKVQKDKRKRFLKESASFAATRGFLPLEDIITLVRKHCFATYAVSCCGGTSFSLVEILTRTNDSDISNDNVNSLEPFTIIGHFPPTETQMRRLRFAIALDQPSALIRYSNLFDMNSRDGMPSHFHHEYLQMTLDTYMEQQEALINVIKTSFTTQQNDEHVGVLGESEFHVSFPALRMGIGNLFRQLLLSSEQCNVFAKHLLDYCDMLRCDDDARYEQFRDAVFFINTPSLSPEDSEDEFAVLPQKWWSVEVEAASCSLLHLSFAVRMTYIVWGSHAVSSARLAGSLFPSTTPWQQEDISSCFEESPLLSAMRDTTFLNKIKREYFDALNRVKSGMTQHNELRRLVVADVDMTTTAPAGTRTGAAVDVVKTPSESLQLMTDVMNMNEATNISFDICSLFAPWCYDQQKPTRDVTRNERRPNTSKKTRSSEKPSSTNTGGTINQTFIPEVASLTRFMGVSRLGKVKNDKKGKLKTSKGLLDIHTTLLTSCAHQENEYMSYYMQILKILVEAAQKTDYISMITPEVTTTKSRSSNPSCDGGNLSSGLQQQSSGANISTISSSVCEDFTDTEGKALRLPDVLLKEGNETNKTQRKKFNNTSACFNNITLQQIRAGCATLSLM